ncbi:hypothetical protein ACVI1J_006480 [Bradyrhizobium diazoefficiens]|jgi:hypothetical protein|uniref:Uncharacterized protein n=1 Tax=Bradyrhizobium barranii subsp. barranii TaxID=2823807 RepID=A0A7Z0TMX1_9BRAD|nr:MULTISPECIES: hypothetical protein [Bradyrhizobium]MCP1790920.1 hypothetical protein [Bradyrhizobium japonicum]MCP1880006.1 hypothetical protein [Bradyrhizobium japonicum]MCP1934668.1 hypothetical protein [Bradyrhizobium japonicum]MCP1947957.1 hypothetical protein [Bradyrhizobium japonicum]MCS4025018.1 hypothetical protein [Bradyrhizobium japonicum]
MLILPFRRIIPSAFPPVTPGSMAWTTPGTYTFTVPAHRNFNYDVRGAGGGGQGPGGMVLTTPPFGMTFSPGGTGDTGGTSQVYLQQNPALLNVIGFGGQGGANQATGAAGTAQGGDQNITGGGAAGGAGGYLASGDSPVQSGYGGYGARATRSHLRGIILIGQTLVINVGTGGAPGGYGANSTPFNFAQSPGAYGSNGAVYISWS